MTSKYIFSLVVISVFSLCFSTFIQAQSVKPLLQNGKKSLYQRVLTTPGCHLSLVAKDSKKGIEQPPFSRFYVYERVGSGQDEWLKVGPDSFGKFAGWLPAECTVEWKMQLSLAFTNPANRDRLLFFKDREHLLGILDASDPVSEVAPVRAKLKKGEKVSAILAQEPEFFVDMQNQFYLLPVLSGEEIMTEKGFRTRILNVASVSKADMQNASPDSGGQQTVSNQLKEFRAAVVFVIDSTISMDPYIDRTREAIRKVYERVMAEKLGDQVKFGLVAFRSNVDTVPGLEYVSKMYADPNTVIDGNDFMQKAAGLKQAKVSSSYFDEDVYSGVMHAIDQVNWSGFGARYIVLITDAGAIDGDDELSGTGLNAEQVRIEAGELGIAIYTLHLKTPVGVKNHARAQSQYEELSHYTATDTSLYYPVNAGDIQVFGKKVDSLADALTAQVKLAYMGEDAVGSVLNAKDTSVENLKMLEDVAVIGRAMRLAYLGEKSGTKAPSIFQAWVADRDLIKQNQPTTDVRVLLTKGQLSNLNDVLKKILDAANQGLISPSDMFASLRSIAATMGNDPNQITQNANTKLAELGMLDEYLADLPYSSEVLNLDEETWKSWDGLAQEKFIRTLATKLRHYQRYNADVDRWVSLSENADARELVYPIPLEMMP